MGLSHHARALLQRLARFLDGFAPCFVRRAHAGHAQRYVKGLLSDAKYKNMEGIVSRLVEPGDYQALQHFITHSTWQADRIWSRLRAILPDRRGVFVIDDTGIPKQGSHSVGVASQYCGAVGKIANSQNIVTSALYTGRHTWPIAMELFLPERWCSDPDRREAADVPDSIQHRTKHVMALEQVDTAIAAGFEIDAVLADAGYGESTEFREAIATRGLRYSVGIGKNTTVFASPPSFKPTKRPSRPVLAAGSAGPQTIASFADSAAPREWTRISWRRGVKDKLEAEFLIRRVIPAHRWHLGQSHDEVWLICERTLGADSVRKYYLSNLPAETKPRELVRITHERWAIEMHYRDLKQELGLDHFEGRSYPGFARHLVLTALAYVFLQHERRRKRSDVVASLNAIRRSVTEILTAMLFASGERFASMVTDFARDPPPSG